MIDQLLAGSSILEENRTAIAIGLPVFGGLLVIASSILMPRGKAKGLLTGVYMLSASVGASCLLFVLAACVMGATLQQVAPLLLIGIMLTVIMGIFTPATIREYQQFEFRKLAAQIFRRS